MRTILIAMAIAVFFIACTIYAVPKAMHVEREPVAKKEVPITELKLVDPVPAVTVATPAADDQLEAETVEAEPIQEPAYTSRLYVRIDPEPEEPVDACFEEPAETGEYHEDVPAADTGTYLGEWTITFYCPCSICNGSYTGTASGAPLTPWHTAACGSLPFGTRVYVEGIGEFTVEDTGVSGEWLDLCVESHDQALALGMRTAAVYRVG